MSRVLLFSLTASINPTLVAATTVMLLLAFMNRATETLRRSLQWLFLYVGGTVVCESLLLKLEYIDRSDMHSALFYSAVVLGTA